MIHPPKSHLGLNHAAFPAFVATADDRHRGPHGRLRAGCRRVADVALEPPRTHGSRQSRRDAKAGGHGGTVPQPERLAEETVAAGRAIPMIGAAETQEGLAAAGCAEARLRPAVPSSMEIASGDRLATPGGNPWNAMQAPAASINGRRSPSLPNRRQSRDPDERRGRDSNPRNLAAQRFSRPPQSTTLPPLRTEFGRSNPHWPTSSSTSSAT